MRRALVALAFAVAALPVAAGARQKVAVLDVKSVQGVAPGTATILTAIIAGDTARAGFDVLSQSDIGALIGFERQKKMLGCGDNSSCLAEIGGALGVEYVLFTQVGQIGSRFHISLQLLDARKGIVVGRVSTFSKTNEDALAETAERAVAEVIAAAHGRAAATAAQAAPSKSPAAVSAPVNRESPPPEAGPVAAPPSSSPPTTRTKAGALATTGSWRSVHHPYVEVRLATGWTRAPIPDRDGRSASGFGAGLAARAGFRWTPRWAFEVGGGFQNVEPREFDVRHSSPLYGEQEYGAGAEVGMVFASVGAAWTPRNRPYFAIAGDVGLAAMHCRYWESTYPEIVYQVSSAQVGDLNVWMPRLGAELRLDYPTRWLTAGLRLGVAAQRNGARGTATWFDGAQDTSVTWFEPGWVVAFPISLSVRRAF